MNGLAERTDIRATFDLRRNYFALALCVAGKGYKSVRGALNEVYGAIEEPDREQEARPRKWDDEAVAVIGDMLAEGMSWPAIGKEFGVTDGCVWRVWHKYGKKVTADAPAAVG